MSYTENKAKELCYVLGVIRNKEPESDDERKIVKIAENRIKEYFRDFRHKTAENVGNAQNITQIHNIIMNTNMD